MQIYTVVAAVLCLIVAAAHSWLGERYVIVRLFRRADLPKLLGSDWFTRRTIRFAWHLTSIAWLGFGALLLMLASEEAAGRAASLRIIGGTFIISAAVTAAATRGRHLAWIVFLAIGALATAAA